MVSVMIEASALLYARFDSGSPARHIIAIDEST
jgi:hypothetical protein